jgi:hypothetical protein
MTLKNKITHFIAFLDENISPENKKIASEDKNDIPPILQIAKKMEKNLNQLKYSFPQDLKDNFSTLKNIEDQLLLTMDAYKKNSIDHPTPRRSR